MTAADTPPRRWLIALLAGGIVVPGVAAYWLAAADVGTVTVAVWTVRYSAAVWALGYGAAVLAVWYWWVRPLDLRGHDG